MQGLSRVVQDKASVSMHQNLVETTEACITPGYWKMAFLQALVQPTVTSGSPHLCKLSYLSSSMRFFAVKFSMLHAFNCVLQLLVK